MDLKTSTLIDYDRLASLYIPQCTTYPTVFIPIPISTGYTYQTSLPDKGLSDSDLWTEVDKNNNLNDVDWREGRCSGTVYCSGDDKNDMLGEVGFSKDQRVFHF